MVLTGSRNKDSKRQIESQLESQILHPALRRIYFLPFHCFMLTLPLYHEVSLPYVLPKMKQSKIERTRTDFVQRPAADMKY